MRRVERIAKPAESGHSVPGSAGCVLPSLTERCAMERLTHGLAAYTPSLASDEHTLLQLSFDTDLRTAAGESPSRAIEVTFESGVLNQAALIDAAAILEY